MPFLGEINTQSQREQAAIDRFLAAPQRTPEEIAAMDAASAAYQATEAVYRVEALEEERRRTELIDGIIADETEIAILGAQIDLAESPGANSPEAEAEALQAANELIELLHLMTPADVALGSWWKKKVARPIERETHRITSSVSAEIARAVDLEERWESVEEEVSRSATRSMKDNVRMTTRVAARVVATSLVLAAVGPLLSLTPFIMISLQIAEGLLPPNMTAEMLIQYGGATFAVLSPEDTNRILRDVAKVVNQVDLGVFLPQQLATLTFTELVAESQESRQERDRFRLKIAVLRAQIEARGGPWLAGARAAAQIAQAVIITAVTGPLGPAIMLAVQAGTAALSAATAVLALRQAIETMKAAMRDAERRAAAFVFEEEEEVPEDLPLPPGGAPGGRSSLSAMLLKYGLIGALGLFAVISLTSKKR